jgi:uncharacterized MAPEG superfamily protein
MNLSFYTIPVAWTVALLPHSYTIWLYQKSTSKPYDNRQPRNLVQTINSQPNLDADTKGRIARAQMAQQNGFENIGLFAAAVVAGNMAQLDVRLMNLLSVGYVVSRAVYNLIYINNTSAALATTRTGVFLAGIGIIFSMFIMAGNKLRLQ